MSVSAAGIPDMPATWPERKAAAFEAVGGNDLPRLVLRPGSRIGDSDQPGECCYLIERGLVATYVIVDEQRPTCVGLAGAGDLVGLGTLFGRSSDSGAHAQAIVSVQLLRIPADGLGEMLNRSAALRDTCLQQLQANLSEAGHVAACNARHLLPSRCAHWLLRLQSRLGDVLPVTHEFLSSVLGVRRAGITVTLQGLQRSGAIHQQRGSIVIAEAGRLREVSCGCPIGVARPPWVMPHAAPAVPRPAGLPGGQAGPRAWSEAAIRARDTAPGSDLPATDRIDAVLQVCRAVMERTQQILVE